MERITLTVGEAGALLGIGRSTAYRLAAEGKIPVLRLGKRMVVPVALLMKMLGVEKEEKIMEGGTVTTGAYNETLQVVIP